MSLTKLTCPECNATVRPKAAVAPGKKVRCPKCESVFVAEDPDDLPEPEEDEPKPKKKKVAAKAKAAPPPPPKKKSEDEETYGYIKEEEATEEEEERKAIDYAPDESVRDLRGPAIVKVREAANYLTLAGFLGAGGWLAFILTMTIPFSFPIPDEKVPTDNFGRPLEPEKKAKVGEKSTFHIWWTWDFYGGVINNWGPPTGPGHPVYFWLYIAGFLLLASYSGLIAFGAIKLVNMESRVWGIVSGVLALTPINVGGLTFALAFGIQFGLRQMEIDEDSINYLTIGVGGLLYLTTMALGVWVLIVANDAVVKEGYEYEAE